ncbi:MAG: hypothetical protein WA715_18215 [Candidatus Acidiferrum sp.]|jgi:hypothetical protein
MTPTLIAFGTVAAVLLAALGWALRGPRRASRGNFNLDSLEQPGRRHSTYFSLIRQASSREDLEFLARRSPPKLRDRIHKERRKVVLLYLDHLRNDFERLSKIAKAVAALSRTVGIGQEFERVWLTAEFMARYYAIRLGFSYGFVPLAQLNLLSQMVSQLSIQMETSMKEFGERAALAVRGTSSPFDGNGAGVV